MNKKDKAFLQNLDRPPAVILGDYPITAISLMRSLAKDGIPSIVISDRKSESFYSKYAHGFVCPDVRTDEQAFIKFLIEIGKTLPMKGVLFPVTDLEILPIAQNRSVLEPYYHFTIPDVEIVDQVLNKKKLYRLCEQLQIAHPKTYYPEHVDDVTSITNSIGYPCLIKPIYHTEFYLDYAKKVFVAQSRDELLFLYHRYIEDRYDVVIQDVIPGEDPTIYEFGSYYTSQHRPTNFFVFNRIRGFPQHYGNCSFVKHIQIQELEAIISHIVSQIHYHGILEAEFKKDLRDDTYKLIEINPRAWKTIGYPMSYGLNIPQLAYKEALGESISSPILHKKECAWVDVRDDFLSAIEGFKEKNLTIKHWINSYHCEKEYALFSWDDPLPAAAFYGNSIFRYIPYLIKNRR